MRRRGGRWRALHHRLLHNLHAPKAICSSVGWVDATLVAVGPPPLRRILHGGGGDGLERVGIAKSRGCAMLSVVGPAGAVLAATGEIEGGRVCER